MSIQEDVIKLYKSGAKRIVLDEIRARDSIPAAAGVATFTPPETTARQLKSPLTATTLTKVTKTVTVPSGTTTVDIDCVVSMMMVDANGDNYQLIIPSELWD